MATNQSGDSAGQKLQPENPSNKQSTPKRVSSEQQSTAGKKSGQFSDNLAKSFGHRGKFLEDLNDVSLALGASLLLSSGANVILVLIASFLAVRYPEIAPYVLGGASIFDLPSFFHYFISTFPLMVGTATFCILLFGKVFKNGISIWVAFVLIFFVSMFLGGILGIGNVDMGAINTGDISGSGVTLPFAIIGIFYRAYGPYRFFISILTGIVIAWSISIKMVPYLKKKPPEKSS